MIALLGKPDSPTDAIEDYCRLLGCVFERRGSPCVLVRVRWYEDGWARALVALWRRSGGWKHEWALVQYTALMWSRRGFSTLFVLVLCVLKVRGVRTAVVFHDPLPFAGDRLVDKVRRWCQRGVMRGAYRLSDATILTVPMPQISWLPANPSKAAFIPICSTLPIVAARATGGNGNGHHPKTISVLAVTQAGDNRREISDIVHAARQAAESLSRVRLVTVGRGSQESAPAFQKALEGSGVEFQALGILPARDVAQVLADSDLSLFVRGPITTQRSSAIASIANAVPLVTYAGPDLSPALAEAGIVGVPYLDRQALAAAAVRVLADPQLAHELRARSRRAHNQYFSWEAVASRFAEVLHLA